MNIKLLCKQAGIVLMANLLLGCSSQLVHQNQATAEEIKHNQITKPTDADFIQLPAHPSSPEFISAAQEIYYKFLIAELAAKRGHYNLSARYALEIAQLISDPELAKQAANLALYAQDYALATQATQLWLSLDANNLQARYNLIRILLQQNNLDQVAEQLDNLLLQLTEKPETQQRLINDVFSDQPAEQIKTLVELMLQKSTPTVAQLLLYARLLVTAQELPLAQTVLEQLFAQQQSHVEAVPLYVYVLSQQEKNPQAITWLAELVRKEPQEREWQLLYARLLAEDEQTEAAIAEFERLIFSDQNDPKILYALGILYLQTKKFTQAKTYFSRLLAVEQDNDIALYYLGQLNELEEKHEIALNLYRRINPDSNHYLSAQIRIAMLLVTLDQFEQAIEHIREATTRAGSERLALIQIEVELYMQAERYSEAMNTYDQYLESYPQNLSLRYMRAMLAEKMGQIQLLEQDLNYILSIEPDHVDALNALGYSLTNHTERYAEAYKLIKKALELRPDAYYILDSMGWVLYRQGELAQAIEYLRQAYALQADPEVAAHLGEVLWMNGQQAEAQQIWLQAIGLFPDEEELKNIIRKFMGDSYL